MARVGTARTVGPMAAALAWVAVSAFGAGSLAGCDVDTSDAGRPDTDPSDAAAPPLDADSPDAASDTSRASGPEQDGASDADAVPDVRPVPPPRVWANRAIGGVSMGAMAVNIALESPESFDIVGGLGGYADLDYMARTALRLQLAGFCPLDQLTTPEALASLDDPFADPPVFCGPGDTREELETEQDFNHFHWDTNGATFDRGFYVSVFQSLTMGLGNFTGPASESTPYLPLGLDTEWFGSVDGAARCKDVPPVTGDAALNLEWNPGGEFAAIPFCDGGKPKVEGWPGSFYDPAVQHKRPMDILLALDLNGDGKRDYAEPVLMNPYERFDDVGADGCADAREDGAGGCREAPSPDAEGDDPNGDDFHWWANPFGTERNERWDPGEPYADDGVDGVPGSGDFGEGNGQHDEVAGLTRARTIGASGRLAEASDEVLARLDFYLDGGIRDPLHAGECGRRILGLLNARTGDAVHYRGMRGRPGALLPEANDSTVVDAALAMDLSAESIGRHVLVEYGDPNASDFELANGDGGHVGSNTMAANRVVLFLAFAASRFPDPDVVPDQAFPEQFSQWRHFYSDALGGRRSYTVAVPPGYDDPANDELRYPTVYFLHGLGQEASDFAPIGLATLALMIEGKMPKALMVFPDGACCDRDKETGVRYCACRDGGDGQRRCIDPDCTGPEEACEEWLVPKSQLEEECNGGSLYLDLLTDRWGVPREDLGYGTSVLEVVGDADMKYRTRVPDTR